MWILQSEEITSRINLHFHLFAKEFFAAVCVIDRANFSLAEFGIVKSL